MGVLALAEVSAADRRRRPPDAGLAPLVAEGSRPRVGQFERLRRGPRRQYASLTSRVVSAVSQPSLAAWDYRVASYEEPL